MNIMRYPISFLGLVIALSFQVDTSCAQVSPPAHPQAKADVTTSDGSASQAPTITNQRQFKIPLSVGQQSRNLVEVILHQSIDEGATWKVYKRLAPSADGFEVNCEKEGEYRFALQTRDRNGRLQPPRVADAELVIIVDTSRPDFEFDVRPDAAGRIVGQWSATDPNLDPESLVIQYQSYSAQNDEWIEVPTAANDSSNSSLYQDQLAWWPETASRSLLIKASISDRAGNTTELSRQMLVPQTAHRPAPTRLASAGTEVQEEQQANSSAAETNATHGYQRSGVPAALASSLPNPSRKEQPDAEKRVAIPKQAKADQTTAIKTSHAQPPAKTPPQPDGQNSSQAWPSNSQENQHRDKTVAASTQDTSGNHFGSDNQVVGVPKTNQWKPRDIANSNLVESVGSTTGLDSTGASSIPASNTMISNQTTTNPLDQTPPAAASVLRVNSDLQNLKSMSRPCSSTQFQLQYSIDAIGPEGVKAVELWMTPDGGQNWRRTASDEDRRSPIDVDVQTEGIYGFRIVVISNDGLRTKPPNRGDAADIWINVDSTSPNVAITSAPFGKNENVGKLLVQWSARDANLHMRPITLQYSSQSNGPWTTIEEGIRNTGSYAWKPTKDVPERVYLRIMARDDAGNVGTHQVQRPVDISGLIPRGHIRGIIPIPKPDT